MAVRVEWADWRDLARTVDALLVAAEVEAIRNPSLSRRYLMLADDLGDALRDDLPKPEAPVLGF